MQTQSAVLENMADFPTEIASARTFVFVREIEPLLQMGLIKGGDLSNALVIYERRMEQERLNKLSDSLGVKHLDAEQLGYIQE
ncbi:UDP-3-O-acyl-N-acetylglucosamine deacetylase, partial [Pandoraea pneumonica]|uniref:UDP-3-O-acyl-N-acetylglucosamine deacetylase n=1 Tax=Pandoraea pneumonica TaxID=2508299 RepID=UPI003CE96444